MGTHLEKVAPGGQPHRAVGAIRHAREEPPMPEPARPDVLTADEVAEALRVPRRAVLSMARTRELPMFKVRRAWRINADTFDDWKRAREAALIVPRGPQRRPGQGRR